MAESTAIKSSSVPLDVDEDILLTNESAEANENIAASLTNADFVQEIRVSRLRTLWKGTLISVFVLIWIILLLSGTSDVNLLDALIPLAFIGVSSIATHYLLQREHYETATWAYALGVILTISVMSSTAANSRAESFVPFLGILLIFVIGMLMSVTDTIVLLFISYASMIGVPWAITGDLNLGRSNIFALLLMGLSALLVIQVSGELYGIAEWALTSYRKERKTADELHNSRLVIEKSLLKQKNLTLQMQELNVDLEEARRAAETAKHFRGIFLANMSHELRTPLNAIIGFSDTMLNFPIMYEEVTLPDEYQADLQQINTSGNHLLKIINDILDLSKIDAGRLEVDIERVELEPIFAGVLSQAVGLIGGKPVELRRNLPDVLPDVLGDPLRIRQVIINLYSNAAKFTQDGFIELGLYTEGDRVIISVEDSGPGIDAEFLDTIFEAFTQGKSGKKQQRQGSGLGLAITKELLGLMDGEVWAESKVDRGSIFYISLPKYIPTAEEAESQTSAHAEQN